MTGQIGKEVVVHLGKVDLVEDKGALYGFLAEPSLWLWFAWGWFCTIDLFISAPKNISLFDGKLQANNAALFYLGVVCLGTLAVIFILVDRNRANLSPLIRKFPQVRLKMIITIFNIVAVVGVSLLLVGLEKVSFGEIKHYSIVAYWEQLLFGIAIPYWLTRFFAYALVGEHFAIRAFVPAIILSAVAFGFAHRAVYGMDWGILIYLMLIGGALHFLGYLIPSPSMTIHYLIDIGIMAGGVII